MPVDQPSATAMRMPSGVNLTEVTLPDGNLCHYITDTELEAIGQMQQEPVMEICLASTGVFFGAVVPAWDGLVRFGDTANPTTWTDMLSIALAFAAFGIAAVTAWLWKVRLQGRKNMVTTIRARPRIPVEVANANAA